MSFIDLHIHSIHSDGTMKPAELVDYAVKAGLKAVALTDHDTMSGVAEALAAGHDNGVEVIPGIEVSAWHNGTSMHILGYWLRHDDRELLTRLNSIQKARHDRNLKIIDKLNRMGIKTTMEEVEQHSACGLTGRPHIARLLVSKGLVSDVGKAFRLYLKKGAAAYAERFRFGADDAIQMIRQAGGLAVLAHPAQLDPSLRSIPALLRALKSFGLDGIEVYYPKHSNRAITTLKTLAQNTGLFITGGSDLHEGHKSELALAVKKKKFYVPHYLLEIMKEKHKNFQQEI